jgi:hypothetical protein
LGGDFQLVPSMDFLGAISFFCPIKVTNKPHGASALAYPLKKKEKNPSPEFFPLVALPFPYQIFGRKKSST